MGEARLETFETFETRFETFLKHLKLGRQKFQEAPRPVKHLKLEFETPPAGRQKFQVSRPGGGGF